MITREKLEHHISHLEEKHTALNKQVDTLEQNGHFVDADLNQLKRERLALRDEIEAVKKQMESLNG